MRMSVVLWLSVLISFAAKMRCDAQPLDVVRVEGRVHVDLGPTKIGESAGRTVRLTNTSDRPVQLRIASKSCGCITVKVDPETVPPHAVARVSFETTVVPMAGPQTHGVDIVATQGDAGPNVDAAKQRIRLSMTYTPDIELKVVPPRVTANGVANETITIRVFVQDFTAGALELQNVHTDIEGATARIERQPSEGRAPEASFAYFILRLDLTPRRAGVIAGRLLFDTNGVQSPKIGVPIAIRVRSDWQTSEPGLVISDRDMDFSRPLLRTINVVPPANVGREVQAKIVPEVPGITADVVRQPDARNWKLIVRATPDQLPTSATMAHIVLSAESGSVDLPLVWIPTAARAGVVK